MPSCCGVNWNSVILKTLRCIAAWGVALAQQGKLEPATTKYRKSLDLKPHQPDVSFNLGIAEFKQGHFSAAIPAFELLAKEKPEDHRSALFLMSYFGHRQYVEANPYLQRALKDDPSNLELHNVLAQSCLWSRQYDCALGEFRAFLLSTQTRFRHTCCRRKRLTAWMDTVRPIPTQGSAPGWT
jgi:Tfp pilus assembly protein PilF